jgi:hypothetical protein
MRNPSRFAVFARGLALALPLLGAFSANAYAAHGHPGGEEEDDPRVFGLGSAFGAGIQAVTLVGLGGSNAKTGILPAVDLPTLEFRYFLKPQDWTIDVSIPLTNMIIVSAATHGFYFNADAYLNFNVGKGSLRLTAGPGIGLDVLAVGSSGGSGAAFGIKVLGEVGFEALSSGRHFGFQLLARPFVEFVPAGGIGAVGGGALLMFDFMGYVTKK